MESDVSEGEISLFFHDESFDGIAAEPCQEDDECNMQNSAKKRKGEEKLQNDKMDEMDVIFIDRSVFQRVNLSASVDILHKMGAILFLHFSSTFTSFHCNFSAKPREIIKLRCFYEFSVSIVELSVH